MTQRRNAMHTIIYNNSMSYNYNQDIENILLDYKNTLSNNNVEWINEPPPFEAHWSRRALGFLINNKNIKKKPTTIIVYDAPALAHASFQVIEMLHSFAENNIDLYFIKYQQRFSMKNKHEIASLIKMIQTIQQDFQEIHAKLPKRSPLSAKIGRPKGSKNRTHKLDSHQNEIKQYLKIGISKASIAKLVQCHPQTLTDWLERKYQLETA